MSTTTSVRKVATDLVEGDIIDLQPALEQYSTVITGYDISEFEMAIVDSIDVESPGVVVVYTDQHNIAVPTTFEFETMVQA